VATTIYLNCQRLINQKEINANYHEVQDEDPKETNEIFKQNVDKNEIKIYIIDSSGSMRWDIYTRGVGVSVQRSRMEEVKEKLISKISTFSQERKYYIWESQGGIFNNLDASRNFESVKSFIENIKPHLCFYYSNAFQALTDATNKIHQNEIDKVSVSLLTDGGVEGENPSEMSDLKNLLNRGVKKWELILYDKGGEETDEERENNSRQMEQFKKACGI